MADEMAHLNDSDLGKLVYEEISHPEPSTLLDGLNSMRSHVLSCAICTERFLAAMRLAKMPTNSRPS